MRERNEYYFKGKRFATINALIEYAAEWGQLPLDEETADNELDRIKRDIVMNIFLLGREFNNYDFNTICNDIFYYAIDRIAEYEKEKVSANKP